LKSAFARRAVPAQRETVDADAPRLAIILDDLAVIAPPPNLSSQCPTH